MQQLGVLSLEVSKIKSTLNLIQINLGFTCHDHNLRKMSDNKPISQAFK